MNIRRYKHNGCPECGHKLARNLGNGKYQCKAVGCYAEFSGTRKQQARLGQNRKRQAKKREQDFGALNEIVRTFDCCVNGCGSRRGLSAHHVKTRGSGGSAWLPTDDGLVGNLVPLCFECHTIVHSQGEQALRERGEFMLRKRPSDVFADTLASMAIAFGEHAMNCGVDPLTNTRKG